MNIAAVIVNTKRDSSKIERAGVETGAKMFVGLSGECAGSANAVTAAKNVPLRK